MGYRVRYDGKGKSRLWWLVPVVVLAAGYGFERWYWDLARYVGACIRGG